MKEGFTAEKNSSTRAGNIIMAVILLWRKKCVDVGFLGVRKGCLSER